MYIRDILGNRGILRHWVRNRSRLVEGSTLSLG